MSLGIRTRRVFSGILPITKPNLAVCLSGCTSGIEIVDSLKFNRVDFFATYQQIAKVKLKLKGNRRQK